MFNFLVLQTTANYPDFMLPFYKKNRFAFFFFALYLVIQYLILANTIIAFFYYQYQHNIKNENKKYVRNTVFAR